MAGVARERVWFFRMFRGVNKRHAQGALAAPARAHTMDLKIVCGNEEVEVVGQRCVLSEGDPGAARRNILDSAGNHGIGAQHDLGEVLSAKAPSFPAIGDMAAGAHDSTRYWLMPHPVS